MKNGGHIFLHKFNSQKPRFINVHHIIAGAGIPIDLVLDHCSTIGAPNTLDMDVLNIPGDRLDLWIINSTAEMTHEETKKLGSTPEYSPHRVRSTTRNIEPGACHYSVSNLGNSMSEFSGLPAGGFEKTNVDPNNQGFFHADITKSRVKQGENRAPISTRQIHLETSKYLNHPR